MIVQGRFRQPERASAAQSTGGVGAATPRRFELNVLYATDIWLRAAVTELAQGFCNGLLSKALRIGFGGIDEEVIEDDQQIGEQFRATEIGSDARRPGHHI